MPVPVTSLGRRGRTRMKAAAKAAEQGRSGAKKQRTAAEVRTPAQGGEAGAYAYGGFKYRSEAVPVLG